MTELVRVTHGVHRPASQLRDETARVAALLSACPAGTVIAGVTAARLHGLWLPNLPGSPVEVVLRSAQRRPQSLPGTRRSEIRGRRRVVPPDQIDLCAGLPVTSAARTWLDLSERLGLADLVAAGDSALRGDTTLGEIDALLGRAGHRRGVVVARSARDLLDRRSRSRPESHLRVAIVTAGLPVPDVNQAVFDVNGQWLFEPDLGYADVRLAIEHNGADHADVGRTRRDITRAIDGYDRGDWQTVTFGPAEVFSRPDQVVATVAALRRERELRDTWMRPAHGPWSRARD